MDSTGTFFMPEAASTTASDVDSLFYFILYISIFFFLLIVVIGVFFAIKYRRRGKAELRAATKQNLKLELMWTLIPTVIVISIFFWGFNTYLRMHVVPKDALEIKVTGQQWFWTFDYPGGVNSLNELVVPVGKPVKLLMSSKDVIHSFYIPDFRVKMDVLPNRYTVTWFQATRTGTFNLFCAEYCGTKHSSMIGTVKVLSEREYNSWLEEGAASSEGMTPEEYGGQLYRKKACVTCHNIDGKINVGPNFRGIFGKQVDFSDGSSLTVDENYIRESILSPQAKVVAGFDPVMPTYQGLLNDRELDALIAYIKSLK
jgi:cytochrome c oxidase subunit 2